MKYLKKFNEALGEYSSDEIKNIANGAGNGFGNEDEESPVKVKHLIEYLKQFDPEMDIFLDKDDWEEENPAEAIESSGIFHIDSRQGILFINN